jgi:hypothetical protein
VARCAGNSLLTDVIMPNLGYFLDKVFCPQREDGHNPPTVGLHYLARSALSFEALLLLQSHEETLVTKEI